MVQDLTSARRLSKVLLICEPWTDMISKKWIKMRRYYSEL
jgi:hypothetical protein